MSTDTSPEGRRLFHLRNYLDDPTVIEKLSDDELTLVAVPLEDLTWLVEQATVLRAENERIVADVTAAMDDMVEVSTMGSKARSVPSPAARVTHYRHRVVRLLHAAEHNHMTRDIKAPGKCPACDRYHAKHGDPLVTYLAGRDGSDLPDIDGNFPGPRPTTAEMLANHTKETDQ